uniref:Cytochrome P450 monooxygenase ecdH n=1 Tax=Aspergillus pachycristata (strain ATCC 58397 / KCTC 6058 / NRRL 11440 / A42355) TaxID=590939 RepID=ECDH_ASPP1|nr:RecName: Full=Cytochrome P450 monooxygenase ecdH; AltName: Full=Echinocandin B biosynthetic cluster protein H [Aspergillus rugulosus]AFT91389.1 EcdH [Aspergillus rugulosus]
MEFPLYTTTLLCGVISSTLLLLLLNKLTTWEHIVPSKVPWIDRRSEPFGYLRAKCRSFFNMKENITEAYYAFNKEGRAAALAIAFGRPQIILPPKYIRWIIDQPESVLSIDPIHNEFHAFVRDGLVGDHLVQEVLRRELAGHLAHLTREMNEEIADSVESVLGVSKEWATVPLRDSMRIIIARISNRLFVGKELCRNEDYIRNAVGLGMAVMPQTLVQDLLPQLLKGPLSFATKLFTRITLAGLSGHLSPVVRQRIQDVQTAEKDQLPLELLTWMAQRALQRGESATSIEEKLIARIAMANLASIETTTNTITKCMEDMTALSNETGGYLELMRQEAHTVLEACNYSPIKADLEKLVHIENALKESLRLAVVFPGLIRQVTSRTGVTLDDGTHLPHGARISVAAYAIHRDDANWTDAARYDPSRHEKASLPMSRGSEQLLSFGLGKRACPGRFFVTDELKLLFAHILTKYEFKVIKPPVTKVGLLKELTMRGPQEQLVIRRVK